MAKKKASGNGLFKFFDNVLWGKLIKTTVVLFVCIWLLDYLVHSILLADLYAKSAKLFLPYKVIMARMPWMLLAQILSALFLVVLYSQGYSGKGSVLEGIRYGIYLALLMYVPYIIISYVMYPYPLKLDLAMGGAMMVQTVIYGGIIGALYKK